MSNINTLINNAVKDIIFDKDYIVLIRDGCYTVISASDFLDYFVNGGQGVCDSVMNCWHVMGDFAGVHIDENGEDEECNCQYDTNPRIHFPKGEGIKIITSEEQAKVPDSIYILAKQEGEELYYELIIVDEAGNKRKQKVPTGSSGGTITGGENSGGGIPIYQGENADKIKIASIKSIGGSVAVSTDQGSVNLEVPVIGGKSSSNYGTPVYDGLDADKKIKILPVSSGQINIQKKTTPEGQDYLDFDIPVSADETIKAFYVNEKYTGGGSDYKGEGSILKPFKKLVYAYEACIGKGSAIAPQFGNATITVQSDCTVTQSDLDSVPKLKNKLSINRTRLECTNSATINLAIDNHYPFSTSFLKNEAIASGWQGEARLDFGVVSIYSDTIAGIFDLESYTGNGINVVASLKDVSISSNYNSQLFTPLFDLTDPTKPIDYFGTQVKAQVNTVPNQYPIVYLHGFNSIGLGSTNIGRLNIANSSQTLIKIENTTISLDTLKLQRLGAYITVDSLTNRKPKNGIYRMEVVNSWVALESILMDDETTGLGGDDALIRYFDNNSYGGSNLTIRNGFVYNARCNKVLSVNGTVNRLMSLRNCDFTSAQSYLMALYNENGTSNPRTVYLDGSKINNVKKTSISGIEMGALLAYLNGTMFSTLPYYNDQKDAQNYNAIPNTFYLKSGGVIAMVTNY